MSNEKPVRGEVWDVDLDPVLGHEQGRKRPALVFRPSSIDGQRSPEFLEYPGLPVSRTCQSKIVGTPVVPVNEFNQGPSGLVTVVSIPSRDRGVRSRVAIEAGEAGLTTRSFAMSEALRSISLERMTRRRGMVSPETMEKVEYCGELSSGSDLQNPHRACRGREGGVPNCPGKLHDPRKPAFRRPSILPQQLRTAALFAPPAPRLHRGRS